MLCSAQEINKRLIEKGLAERAINGVIYFTDAGEGLGEVTSKVTKYGYPFSNIEWDESVLSLIFSKDEFESVADKKAIIDEIISKHIA